MVKRIPTILIAITIVALVVAAWTAAAARAGDQLAGPNGEHKVVVCKYVGTPGVDETLQTGQNPIVVDYHSLTGDGFTGVFPFTFSDAQGQSVAVQWTFDEHFSDLSVCPAAQGCTEYCDPTSVAPVPPVDVAATCSTPESVNVPDQPYGVETDIQGNLFGPGSVTITFSADEGYTLDDDAQTVYTFDLRDAGGPDCHGGPPPPPCPQCPPPGGGNPPKHVPQVPKAPTLKQYVHSVNQGNESGGG